jgi:hypothetical protein
LQRIKNLKTYYFAIIYKKTKVNQKHINRIQHGMKPNTKEEKLNKQWKESGML